MNKTVLLILTVAIASLTGGCSFFSNFEDAQKEIEDNPTQPIPVKADNTDSSAETTGSEETAFADLEATDQEKKAAKAPQAVSGLVPATNPDARVRNSIRGRQDPFSIVTLVPKIEIETKEAEKATQPLPQPRLTNRSNRERPIANQSRNSRVSANSNTSNKFNPKLAQEVIISGLFESNSGTKLIVQAPEESTSRYVEVGQYLSNGQVLVKRIDRHHFPTPLVILEQSGVEVSKTIGEVSGDANSKLSSLPSTNNPRQDLVSNLSFDINSF